MAKPKAEPLPHVTPEIAKAVYDSLPKPSRRQVADRLNASGKYQPISDSAIQRWKQAGWVAKTDNPDQHRNKGPEEKLGQALVVATGDPCADVQRTRPTGDDGEFEKLVGLSLDVLQDQATRDRWATYILAQRLARARLADPELKADQIAKMERALSGALKDMAAAQAAFALVQARLNPPQVTSGDGAKVIDHDEFDDIMGAFRKVAASA